MSTNDIAELLRKGIEAAREGKRNEAREYFEQVVELDEKNEKGWFWLASVVDTDEERRICLSNVLHINPNNERAKRAMDALQSKAKEKKAAENEEEVVAGVSRRQMTLIAGGGAIVVILILIIALVVITGNNNREAAERATAAAVAQAATQNALDATAAAVEATASAEAATATQLAIATPTTVPPSREALPPTWTPTPEATQPPTREALTVPLDLTGRLSVWSGQDLLRNGFLPLGYYDLEFGNAYQQIGNAMGRDVTFGPNGQRVIYTVYDPLLFSTSIELININGTQVESLPERWRGQNVFEPQMPNWGGPSGSMVVFVARTAERQTTQVFLLDINAPSGGNALRQLTDDESVYTFPALSPDGTRVAVVRANENTANPTIDLVNIDVMSGSQVPVTNDGRSYTETSPTWTLDGSQIIFAAVPSNEAENSDIWIRNSNGTGSSLPLYRSPANDIYPVLSPDGRYVAFASNASGAYDIYVYDQNDGTLSQLTDTPEADYPGDWWQP